MIYGTTLRGIVLGCDVFSLHPKLTYYLGVKLSTANLLVPELT